VTCNQAGAGYGETASRAVPCSPATWPVGGNFANSLAAASQQALFLNIFSSIANSILTGSTTGPVTGSLF
jgi:hypothetical protein